MAGRGRVVLFDGVCNLCAFWARFIIPRDRDGRIKLAALQSEPGRAILERHGLPADDFDTIVMVEGETLYLKSDALLRIVGCLRFPWRALVVLRAVPRPLRDWVYDRVAANRFAWFGRRESCLMPTDDIRERFL